MTENKLYKGMNHLDEDLILEAYEYPDQADNDKHNPGRILMEAAVILFFAGLVFFSTVSISNRSGNTAITQTPPPAEIETEHTADSRTDSKESDTAGADLVPASEFFSTHQFRERETTANASTDTVTILCLIILSVILLLSIYWIIRKKPSFKRL